MAKKIIKRFMPSDETIKSNKSLQFLGERLHDPNLWHLNRRSVAKAFAIGLFFAWVPLPTQMAMAAGVAFYFRAHLAISVALVWITNPLTMPPMFYFAYLVGMWAMQIPPSEAEFIFSVDNILATLGDSWQPFLVGCFILGIGSSILGFFGIHCAWRYQVRSSWKKRNRKA
ncbi:MAG: DUF2062 domain-containing protein [Methylococcales bacterium]|jgi:uncharacterized protein (DUF2062 family)|nr:DUF2062 domain-containing protein [Methylococcaceae bacterium]HIL41183.1 DUF2062 domain-containing protein [Methylococcales bacterium]